MIVVPGLIEALATDVGHRTTSQDVLSKSTMRLIASEESGLKCRILRFKYNGNVFGWASQGEPFLTLYARQLWRQLREKRMEIEVRERLALAD